MNIEHNIPLSQYSTIRIGGPAESFVRVKTEDNFIEIFKEVYENQIPHFILGLGANTLISDEGFSGLVIKNELKGIKIIGEAKIKSEKTPRVQREESHWKKGFLSVSDLDYDDETEEKVLVEIKSGEVMAIAISETIKLGLSGLQWFSGIPATIGGGIFNNIHGLAKHLGDYVVSAKVLIDGKVVKLEKKDLEFKYDGSIFHKTRWPILSITFALNKDKEGKAAYTAKEFLKRKVIQPKTSLGCAFKNISKEEKEKSNLPTESVGYIIDKVLEMKGFKVGDIMVSESHSNFLINTGNGKAEDYKKLVDIIKDRTKVTLGIKLKEEIFYA